jgi:uncharacterized protein YcfJ
MKSIKSFLFLLVTFFFLAASSAEAQTDPNQTAPKKGMSRKAKGAIIGTGAGAVGGGIIGGRKGAVIGGAAGAVGGGIIGRKKDKKKDPVRHEQYSKQ